MNKSISIELDFLEWIVKRAICWCYYQNHSCETCSFDGKCGQLSCSDIIEILHREYEKS